MVKPGPLWVAGISSGGEHSAAEQLEGRFLGRAVPFSPAEYTHTHARTHAHAHTHTHAQQGQGQVILDWYSDTRALPVHNS